MNDLARVNLSIPKQLQDDLAATIPHGMRNNVYLALIAQLAEQLKADREGTLVMLLAGKFEIVPK